MRDSARSCFLYNCEMHSSRSMLAAASSALASSAPTWAHLPGSPGISTTPKYAQAQSRQACQGPSWVQLWRRKSRWSERCARSKVMMCNSRGPKGLSAKGTPAILTHPTHHSKHYLLTRHLVEVVLSNVPLQNRGLLHGPFLGNPASRD